MKILMPLLAVSLLSACTTPAPNKVQLKMEKALVIQEMGEPNITAGEGTTEFFTYYLYPSKQHKAAKKLVPYEVKFVDGKVVKYGIQEE